ncbi:MAG: hypothetical protein K0U20_09245 [Proteobacteria bacterium]|nr:hypothetical protein [Pseudomonadota bacterium]MCH9735766.1 hypothetical protein [Actinomycetes bacterium]
MAVTGTSKEKYPEKRAWFQPELRAFLKEINMLEEATKNAEYRWSEDLWESFSWADSPEGFIVWENLQKEFQTWKNQ